MSQEKSVHDLHTSQEPSVESLHSFDADSATLQQDPAHASVNEQGSSNHSAQSQDAQDHTVQSQDAQDQSATTTDSTSADLSLNQAKTDDKTVAQTLANEELSHTSDAQSQQAATRPRFTQEENDALRNGPRFFHKAMAARARALGEEYTPYRIPAHMRAALAQIDHESALERAREKAAASGQDVSNLKDSDLTLEKSAIEQLHSVSPEEQERLLKEQDEQKKIESGGPRFYSNYQKLINQDRSHKDDSTKARLFRNLKLALIVIVALAGYIAYSEFMVSKDARSIAELKSMLPYPTDAYTTMVRIDDRNDNFKIYFERTPEAYAQLSTQERDAALDRLGNNALMLCNNALLHSIITSGKKVTVLLDATDGSFHREFTVDSCPLDQKP